jgi:Type II intron maturase
LPDAEIIKRFKNIVRGLGEYYKLAGKNSQKYLNEGIYIINFSLLHTLAAKHRMKLSKVIKKYELSPPGRALRLCKSLPKK